MDVSPSSDPNLRPHERFYFSDGSLYLLVERTLYRVHRSLFEIHASKFPARGFATSGGDTLFLKDVEKVDFDRLLACLYPRALLVEEAETTEEWISILKLASKWGFETLRSRAMSRLEQTVASAVDMVVLGRQYRIPNILLHGYVALCQGITPLSSEEGHRLGVDDVINIYRIRHELYGTVTAPISFENVLEKVRIFLPNEEQENSQDLETERADSELNDGQTTEWTDVDSVATSPTSLAEDSHTGVTGSAGHVVRSLYEQQRADANVDHQRLVFDVLPTYPETSEAQTIGPIFRQWHAGVSSPGDECCESFDRITMGNFRPVSDDIIQWIQAKPDGQRLYRIARMAVKKAMEEPEKTDMCVLLCQKMAINLKNRKFQHVLGMGNGSKGNTLLRRYVGEICQEILMSTAVSIAAADASTNHASESQYTTTYPERARQLRLIEFMARFSESTSSCMNLRPIVNKWVTSLLDAHDEEKLVTLCLLLRRAGPVWDTSKLKLRACMDGCFQKMIALAPKTNNPHIRTLLQDVIKYREWGWVAA